MRVRSEGLSWQEVDGHVVVLDLQSSKYLEINATGSALWDQLVAGATEAELEQTLVDRYGISAQQAAADVAGFLSLARERRLLDAA